jgi:hypothetical protein
MTSVIDTRRFGVESFRPKPVARITPEEATAILGSRVQFSGAGSTVDGSYDNLTLFWKLAARPVDSTAFLSLSDTADKAVNLEADVTGTYVVTLYVEADGVQSDTATAAVFFSPAAVPAAKRVDVDGSFMFGVLSDFWKLVNDREMFPIVWSSMTQAVASDFLRAVQVDRAKSISTIQPLLQTRWLKYSPELVLDPAGVDIIYGGMQSGEGAFTGSITFVGNAVVIARTEVLISGPTTVRAIGTTMKLFSGTSRGEYLINNVNSDGTGYIVSSSTPLAGIEARTDGTTLVVAASVLDEIYDLSGAFSSVESGDFVQILAGVNAGYYEVAEVVSGTRLRLTEPLRLAASNMRYRVLRSVRASFKSPQNAYTDTVYILADEADLSAYDTASLTGSGQILNNFEIRLESRHVLDSVQGAKIRILSGSRAGTSFEISTINASGTGVIIAVKISGTVFPETVSYAIELSFGFKDRIMILDGVGHRVATYERLVGLFPLDGGGVGDLWAITLESATAPSGRVGIHWRICPTLRSDFVDDFEALGVSAGDTIEFLVQRTDLQIGSIFRGQVFGAKGNEIAFDIGTQEIPLGVSESGSFFSGTLDPADVVRMAVELSIPEVVLSESGSPIYTSAALDIYEILHSSDFRRQYQNLPLDPTSSIPLPSFFQFTVRPTRIIRNSRIPLDPEKTGERVVYSIPALFEYISSENTQEAADGTSFLLHKDETTSTLTRAPIKLSENNDYAITDTEIRGSALTTRARSSSILIDDRSLVFLGIRPGDEIELLTGMSVGSYVITAVVSESEIRVSGRIADGALPVESETSISFIIRRRGTGRFIEYVTHFGPSDPAPDHLWAPITLFDNSQYIEDNFGLLVGVTKADLDAYGTTQISYRGAVAGLMYAWASGPTLRSAEIGAQIVLDLPVTEKPCEIISIEPEYTESYGRVITEELDLAGLGTGVVNVFRYPRADLYSLEKFRGLGTNPLTGETFAEGDFIAPFTPLTNSVLISDHVLLPNWWREYSDVAGEVELQKYHTWQVEIDVQAVDSRDIPLAADFINKIRPIYTKPSVVAVLSLLDSVQVDARIFIEMDGYFYDDPAFSRESSHIFDSDNGSSLVLRRVDEGSRSTRSLFEGADLVMTAGSGTVTSARGGFTGVVTALSSINTYFTDETPVVGKNIVRPGDTLVVLSGVNKSLFEITAVNSATELEIAAISGASPRGMEIAMIANDSQVRFQITRDSSYEITDGDSFTVDDVITEDDPTPHTNVVFIDSGASFRSDGVTSDDRLIIESGANRGVYIIQELGVFDAGSWTATDTGTPDMFVNQETSLTLATPLPSNDESDSAPYRIERWALQENPVYSGSASGTAGNLYVEISDADLMNIGRDDRLYDVTPGTTEIFYLVTAVYGNRVYLERNVERNFTAVRIDKAMFDDLDGDSDGRLERLMGFDTVELDLYRPVVSVAGTSGSIAVTNSTATPLGGTVLSGDILILTPTVGDPDPEEGSTTSESHGTYNIVSVDGLSVTVDAIFPASETLTGGVWRLDSTKFALDGTSRVGTSEDVRTFGVRAGDFFEYFGGVYGIVSVDVDHFIVVTDLAHSETTSGRIFRRELPWQGRRYHDPIS